MNREILIRDLLRNYHDSLDRELVINREVMNAPNYNKYIEQLLQLRDQKMHTLNALNQYLGVHQVLNNDDLKELQEQLSSRRNSEGKTSSDSD
jgi:predicted metallo-beta-lactamase superfamily hydrolase